MFFKCTVFIVCLITGQTDLDITIIPKIGGHEDDYAKMGYRAMSRLRLYYTSIVSFVDNPIFGVGGYYKTATVANGIGNHSSWLDFLAMYGLVGCIPLMLCFLQIFYRNIKNIYYSDTRFVRIILWLFFMGYGLINPVFVGRCFPVVFALMVAGDVRLGNKTVEFTKWIKKLTKKKISAK